MSANSTAAVICRQVTKEFGTGDTKVQALTGIDLEIPYGEMTLLVGPSGCGKTTLISIMAGLLDPTEGQVILLGKDRRELTGRRLVEFRGEKIGFVFQQYNLLPSLTAAENAAVPLLATKRSVEPVTCWLRLDWEIVENRCRRNFPEVNSSEWPSPERSSTNLNSSSVTNRRRHSMRSRDARSWN